MYCYVRFTAPECPQPHKLDPNPARDGLVASVVRLLVERYRAVKWPPLPGADDTASLLHDLSGLALSKRLILPVSSWAFWGGLLSNASEIHVNAPPHHSVMYGLHQYTYHNEKTREYFGKYHAKKNDIIYSVNFDAAALKEFKASNSGNYSAIVVHHTKISQKAILNTHSAAEDGNWTHTTWTTDSSDGGNGEVVWI